MEKDGKAKAGHDDATPPQGGSGQEEGGGAPGEASEDPAPSSEAPAPQESANESAAEPEHAVQARVSS